MLLDKSMGVTVLQGVGLWGGGGYMSWTCTLARGVHGYMGGCGERVTEACGGLGGQCLF